MIGKVSIVIPLYNYEQYVCNCIDTCLMQKYAGDIEIIVVDDKSTDNSVTKVKQYGDKVKLICHEVNRGYSCGKNTGIRAATGDYITLIDADDMLTDGSINSRAKILNENENIAMVHGIAYTIHNAGDYVFWVDKISNLDIGKGRKKVHAQTVMLRRSAYEKYGLYDEELRSKSDNEMWYRLIYLARVGIFKIENPPVAFYRKHDKSMIEMRKANSEYNDRMQKICDYKKELRGRDGITRNNTIFF